MKLFVEKPSWYAAGLAFECRQCGACCAGPEEGYVWVTREQVSAMALHLDMDEKDFRRRYVRRVGLGWSLKEDPQTRDCIFLAVAPDGRRTCRVYPCRPAQCRTWPFWQSNLCSPGAWALAGQRCPGINRGRPFSRDEIEARRRATDA